MAYRGPTLVSECCSLYGCRGLTTALSLAQENGCLAQPKGEFTVPEECNDPLPKDVEDEFYK